MTPRQSNSKWSGDIASHSDTKIPSAKIRCKILASILKDQDGILVIDFLSKGQTINAENYSSLGAIGEYFEGKFHEGCLVLALQCPASPGTCNQEETGLAVPPVS